MNFPVEDKATGYAMEISQLFDSSDLAAILYLIISSLGLMYFNERLELIHA